MKNKAIITQEVGKIYGRDAIYLDLMQQNINTAELIFEGDFNSSLISVKFDCDFVPYKFIFKHVIYFQCCELESYTGSKTVSQFDVVENSDLLLRFNDLSTENHKHFVLETYDWVYDILAVDYKLEILELKNKY